MIKTINVILFILSKNTACVFALPWFINKDIGYADYVNRTDC